MAEPPDAPEAAESAAIRKVPAGSGTKANNTAHDPRKCATCLLGIKPWTEARRAEALTYAATAGRRIIDLAGPE